MAEKEYIEREAAKKVLAYDYAYNAAKLLDEVPKADVQKVRHGEWIKSKNERKCSLCGYFYFTNTKSFNYCPHCGTKMDKT